MSAATVASLVEVIRSLRLLEPQLMKDLARTAGRFADARTLARDLLQRNWLTAYQINQLLQGRGAELVLGSYILLERLGEGGMGQVFKAQHQAMGRIVALKLLRTELMARPEAIKRFRREIQLVAQLSHPNIVLAFDAAQVGQSHFLAMEYVEGIDLGRLVKMRGPLSVRDACDSIRQVALGLQHAHERGLVHRDIKPSNLLRANQGNVVKLLDLGLARLQESEEEGISSSVDQASSENGATALTHAGKVMGTPDYIAPEQARDSRNVDIRADLYSLGCTFFFLLVGYPPFRGSTALEKLVRHQTEQPPALEKLRPEVPASVAAIVRRLMAKLPDQRFQTPAQLAAALGAFENPTPLPQAIALAPNARRTGVIPVQVMAAALAAVPTAAPAAAASQDWQFVEQTSAARPRADRGDRGDRSSWALLGCLGISLFLLSGSLLLGARLGLFDKKFWTDGGRSGSPTSVTVPAK